MSIADTERAFVAREAAPAPAAPNLFGARAPLNIVAAQVAATLKHRVVTAGILSALARLADFVGLAAVSAAIFMIYVAPVEGLAARYMLASLVLPAATVILIGSLGFYTVASYRRGLAVTGRAAATWTGVFGSFTLVLFFLKMGEDFSRSRASELVRHRPLDP